MYPYSFYILLDFTAGRVRTSIILLAQIWKILDLTYSARFPPRYTRHVILFASNVGAQSEGKEILDLNLSGGVIRGLGSHIYRSTLADLEQSQQADNWTDAALTISQN